MDDLTLTGDERKKLLHAYETILFNPVSRWDELTRDEQVLVHSAGTYIISTLGARPVGSLKKDLHGGGEWEGENVRDWGHWRAVL